MSPTNLRIARLPVAGLLLIALLLAPFVAARGEDGAPAPGAERSVTWPGRTMGTYANVTIVTADSASLAPLAARHDALHRVDSLMSNWTTTSEVARINRVASAGPTIVEPEVAIVVDSSLAAWRATGGAFDITVEPLVRLWGFIGGPRRVPTDAEVKATLHRIGARHVHFDRASRSIHFDRDSMSIDLGGIAKGYAVEQAAKVLSDAGIKNSLVNLTGNMRALGAPPGAAAWRIGIRDPRDRLPYFARITISNEGISTSGQYEQFAANGRTYSF
jgi:thiamine biosynthesis lipoprotein